MLEARNINKINLLDFDRQALAEYFQQMGEKPFRAQQIFKWLHQIGETDFAAMTNLSVALRKQLAETAEVRLPEVVTEQLSNDGTRKWLLRLSDGNCIELVYIPTHKSTEADGESDEEASDEFRDSDPSKGRGFQGRQSPSSKKRFLEAPSVYHHKSAVPSIAVSVLPANKALVVT